MLKDEEIKKIDDDINFEDNIGEEINKEEDLKHLLAMGYQMRWELVQDGFVLEFNFGSDCPFKTRENQEIYLSVVDINDCSGNRDEKSISKKLAKKLGISKNVILENPVGM